MTGLVIFGLLCLLMITGMPISIALGLTVLTFLFTMTEVPLESVALKLFTGIEKFEIMAIPFFILAGNFLTHGGVAKRMIRFATALVGHLHGGLALGGVVACALFAAVSGSSPATVVAIGSILLPAMVKQGYPKKFGTGVIATAGGLGILIPPSIVMVIYAVSTNSSIGKLFIAGIIPGLLLAAAAADRDVGGGQETQLSAHAAGELQGTGVGVPRKLLGAGADRRRHRRDLQRHLHADGSRGDERDVRVFRLGVRLQGPDVQAGAEGAAGQRQPLGDDPVHHHQCGAVLVPADRPSRSRKAWPRGSTRWGSAPGCSWWS